FSLVGPRGGSIRLVRGGAITEAINWHWIFFVNLPIGAATALLALRLVEHDEGIGLREGADVPGAVLITSGLMTLVYTILKAGDYGWSSAHTLGFGAVSLALLTGFVALEAPVDGSYATDLLPVMVLLGAGAGVAFPSLAMLAMSGATREDSGLASGLVNTSLQVGGAIGLAVLATLATTRTDSLRTGGDSTAS